MSAFYLVSSILLAVAWIPILIKFIRAWRSRNNPVSLAICGIIGLSMYTTTVSIAVYAFDGNTAASTLGIYVFNAIACANFYFAFRRAEKRFPPRHN